MEDKQTSIFTSALRAIAFQIEEEHKKKPEKLKMFFDYKKQSLQQYYKFENDLQKYSAGETQFSEDKDSVTLAELFTNEFKKKLPVKDLHYIDISFSLIHEKESIDFVEIFYLDTANIPRHFDSRKDDSYNLPKAKN